MNLQKKKFLFIHNFLGLNIEHDSFFYWRRIHNNALSYIIPLHISNCFSVNNLTMKIYTWKFSFAFYTNIALLYDRNNIQIDCFLFVVFFSVQYLCGEQIECLSLAFLNEIGGKLWYYDECDVVQNETATQNA